MCWWRLGRAWRYENSVNQLRSDNVDPADLELFVQHRQALLKETEAITLELEKAQVEILDTGQIPQELKQKFLAWGPPADQIWQRSEQSAAEELDSLLASAEGTLTPRRRAAYLGLFTVRTAELCLKRWTDLSVAHFDETALADCLIPNRDALDKLIRYETSVERSLGRAVDRLERLQRRRKGEPMPPPVNVHLT